MLKITVVLLSALLLSTNPASGQMNTGEISGVVEDGSGGVLPGATVIAIHPESGTLLERISDSQGRYFLPALRTGTWNITVTMPGFAVQTQQGIDLEIGRTLELTFTLSLEGVSEEVIVSASTPLLQTTTSEISDVIENREVVQIPLNGRNFLALAQLSDAVVIVIYDLFYEFYKIWHCFTAARS